MTEQSPQVSRLINDTDASVGDDIRLDPRIRLGARDGLALKVGEEARVGAGEGAGAAEAVDLAGAAQVRRARGVGGRVRAGEVLAADVAVEHGRHVLEDGPLDQHVAARVNLERVARRRVRVPVVVDRVQQRVALHLGRAAREVVDIVALERDKVLRTVKEQTPVRVRITIRRVGACSVEVIIGYRYPRVCARAEHNLLASDLGDGNVLVDH